MAYLGTTAASSVSNPPVLISGALTRSSTTNNLYPPPQVWAYTSTHRSSELAAAGFFSDGYKLGMRVADHVNASFVSSHGSTTMARISAMVSAISTAGAVTVIASTVVSST